MEPSALNKNNEQSSFENVYKYYNDIDIKKIISNFKIRNRIRIPAFNKTFEKKYSNNKSREIFVVNKTSDTNHITYKLKDLNNEDIIGSFELKKAAS